MAQDLIPIEFFDVAAPAAADPFEWREWPTPPRIGESVYFLGGTHSWRVVDVRWNDHVRGDGGSPEQWEPIRSAPNVHVFCQVEAD